ncbi:TPA: IS4 family transposase, partial [bacterium]|nr:IS4 family transposase [bacterium]
MHTGKLVFAQLMELLPLYEFQRCVQRYQGNYRVKNFSCLDQFLCMAFAQLTYRESLRDIESCLRAMEPRLYHMGIRSKVSRSTLARANENRDWRIYADFAQVLIGIARPLYLNDDFGVQLKQTAYAFDSTTIDLCLELFPWAKFRKTKAAIKLHTLLNLRGSIPEFIHITKGKVHDVNILDLLIIQPGSFYVMDRGYLDFARLYAIHQSSAFFVTRAKRNLKTKRRYSRPVDKATGLRSDQTIVLTGIKTARDYPEPLRRISYRDPETGKHLVFLTNNFVLPALTIALLFKA